ncbi:MAG: tRNA dihydrouridine(20/20a) synthase DusA [Alphaproteobacteria bacterium]|nr:tRNA dihydrouridine(20/20a) synthase DusA [Alphaproteobacteria bacterium]
MTCARRGQTSPLSIAPMMDRTDRHFRALMRQVTRRTLLYTEMVTTGALLHGDPARHLDFDPVERPLSLQLGGDDPAALAACARMAETWGYDEVNLNVGCPSGRVQSGNFGVCLMGDPQRVADGVAAMRAAVSLPVTVKHRIGFDDLDRYADMLRFVDVVAAAGADRFTVHARKAWLKGLSPKENRNVPPLRYGDVHRLKRERPGLSIEINGGVRSLDAAAAQLAHVDAVMIGRAAYDDPLLFAPADRRFYDLDRDEVDAFEVVEGMLPYVARRTEAGDLLHHITRHMLNLFAGQPGARGWRRHLSRHRRGVGREAVAMLQAGLTSVRGAQRRAG